MGDLIERLRSGDASWELREKAADALEAKDAEIERLRAVVDGLCDMLEEVGVDSHSALAALEDDDE